MEATHKGIARRLAQLALCLDFDSLPADVIAAAKCGMLDLLGVTMLGSKEHAARTVSRVFGTQDTAACASILGTTARTSAASAAMINGYASHALDYDDTQHDCCTHMTAPVLSGAFAMAESMHKTGKELLTAYVAGFEVGCRLARAGQFGRYLLRRKIHSTGLLGHFGAVAAVGKLAAVNEQQMARGYGLGASFASGITKSFGTMAKPLHAGNAAQNAVRAIELAANDFTAPDDVFEGEGNIFEVCGGETNVDELFMGLGEYFEIRRNTFKLFACAGWRNPIVEAAVALAQEHDLQLEDIEKVHVHACAGVMHLPNYPDPKTGLEGKFSSEHAAAVALADRAGGMQQFTDERVLDGALVEFRRRVDVTLDPELKPYEIRVTLQTAGGRHFVRFVEAQKGGPRNPATWEELVAKFHGNCVGVVSARQAQAVVELVHGIESLDDVGKLAAQCVPAKRH